MKLTFQTLQKASTIKSFIVLNKFQTKLLRLRYPLKHGWINDILQNDYNEEDINNLLAYKQKSPSIEKQIKIANQKRQARIFEYYKRIIK
jgi:hypothetical protein